MAPKFVLKINDPQSPHVCGCLRVSCPQCSSSPFFSEEELRSPTVSIHGDEVAPECDACPEIAVHGSQLPNDEEAELATQPYNDESQIAHDEEAARL